MIVEAIRRFLAEHGIDGPVVAAVSGGGDSTALLVALREIDCVDLVAAHVNHHLRGAESDADRAFVRDLCTKLNVPLHVEDGTLDADAVRERGVEAAAREVRHARLHAVRARVCGRWIATAHQKNDQAETVLMRLMTGGGIAALRGIHPVRDDGVIRPLLDVRRSEIDAFLRERGITARFDSSNADMRFLRNKVRAMLPESAVDNLAAVAAQARAQWRVLERAIDDADYSVASDDETIFKDLPDDAWLRQAILHKHIRRLDPSARDVGTRELERLAAELENVKRVSVTKRVELLRRGGDIVLRRTLEPTPDFEIELTDAAYIAEIATTITVGKPKNQELRTKNSQLFELPKGAERTFAVRNRRDGDRFHPLGLPSEKKLKDFLIDRKVPAELRDRIPLLVWNGAIVWVAGVEVSERFRVTGAGDLYEVRLDAVPGEA
ncbi:MAG TPA: tRNA lysidine(34) synthetase TilS [Thermoanaerobaculia bacterium]|nr:tRNA lysidine(34) synthetase TilS [Thermoanaerobaculia bacterium]